MQSRILIKIDDTLFCFKHAVQTVAALSTEGNAYDPFNTQLNRTETEIVMVNTPTICSVCLHIKQQEEKTLKLVAPLGKKGGENNGHKES